MGRCCPTREPSLAVPRQFRSKATRRRASPIPSSQQEHIAVVEITGIAAGGDGVGRVDGLAVFVPRTALGDVVRVSYVKRGRLGRGRVLEFQTKSPLRVEPRCPHYDGDNCGGCQLRHLEIGAQRLARQNIVKETLQRVGRRAVDTPSIVFGKEWNYRSRLTLTLRRSGRKWIGGLHRYDDGSSIFSLTQCEIAHPLLVNTWNSIQSLLVTGKFQLPDSNALRVSIRLEEGSDSSAKKPDGVEELMAAVVIEGGVAWPESDRWMSVLASLPSVGSVWWNSEKAADAVNTIQAVPLDGVEVPDSNDVLAFAQVNAQVAEQLRSHVLESVLNYSPRRVIDAYAGTGVLTEALAKRGCMVTAIESDPVGAQSISNKVKQLTNSSDAQVQVRVQVLCKLMEQAVEDLESIVPAADVIVVNPPRRGLDERVTVSLERMAAMGARALVYVSCDPATLARDLARMPSWSIVSVRCFDMFPQTAHVETVCVLQHLEGGEGQAA